MYREKQAYDENRDYAIKSRRRVLESEIERLKSLMYGGNVRIWPYMTDVWGDYSEERTNTFVHQVIEEENYRRMHTFDYEKYMYKLPFYRKLLYCVLRTLTVDYTDYQNGNVMSFERAEKVTVSSVLSSFGDISGELLEPNVVYFMRVLYEILEQKEIELTPLYRGMEEEEITEDMEGQMWEETDAWNKMEEEKVRELGIAVEKWRADEQKEFELQELRRKNEQKKLQETFPEREHFCGNLEEILLYMKENSVSAVEVQQEMRELFFRFLSDRYLTIFDEEEVFVEVMVQLKKTIRTAQSYLEE